MIFYTYSRDTYTFFYLVTFTTFLAFPCTLRLPESPKFLYAHRYFDQAREILCLIATVNRIPLQVIERIRESSFEVEGPRDIGRAEVERVPDTEIVSKVSTKISDDYEVLGEGEQGQEEIIELKGVNSEIFEIWQIRRNLIIFSLIITICSFSFYSLNMSLKHIEGSLIVHTVASQSAEIVANIFGGILYTSMGPKNALFTVFSIALAGSFSLIYTLEEGANGDQESNEQ